MLFLPSYPMVWLQQFFLLLDSHQLHSLTPCMVLLFHHQSTLLPEACVYSIGHSLHVLWCQLVYYVLSPEDWTQSLALAQPEPCSRTLPSIITLISHFSPGLFCQVSIAQSFPFLFIDFLHSSDYFKLNRMQLTTQISTAAPQFTQAMSKTSVARRPWNNCSVPHGPSSHTFPLHCSWTRVGAH